MMVTVLGLPLAPLAMTVICPVRRMPVFSVQKTRMVPEFPPAAPEVMLSQLDPAETLAE